ncbi:MULTISPECIES: hypothetical protein [unclassified Mycobacterium]|uniref:hypothetical protein n=1 Tax=unclassified Mycobacterium TaxID=2642494 RepID=UPI0029C816BA|nr:MULTISPECIES: hypothetical protein [unclassified Mycobacterium]
MNRTPIIVIATMAAGLLIAGLPPALADAAPSTASCTQWSFNGGTEIDGIAFVFTGPTIDHYIEASRLPDDPKHASGIGILHGGISGDELNLGYLSKPPGAPEGLTVQGHVNPDGSAQGTDDRGGTWQLQGAPLKCLTTTAAASPSA